MRRLIGSTDSPLALPAYLWGILQQFDGQHDVAALNPQIACTPSLLEGNLLDLAQVKVPVVSTNYDQHNLYKHVL